jgi:predicted RNase H-like HicB family nuclease
MRITLKSKILVMPYESNYIALCKETGIVRGGKTLEEARDALFSATKTLIEAISENPALRPSLSIGLPLRYRLLFYWTVFKILTGLGANAFKERFLYQIQPLHPFDHALSPA